MASRNVVFFLRLVLSIKSRLQGVQTHIYQTQHRQSRVQGFFIFAGIDGSREKQGQTSEKKNKVLHWLPSYGAFPDPLFCFQNTYV